MDIIDYENIGKHIEYIHTQRKHNNVSFHLHEGYEIFFLVSGDVKYFVEKNIYPLNYGDIIITNNQEIHKPSFSTKEIYERITVHFNPNLVKKFNSPSFDLLNCFVNRPSGELNKISAGPVELDEILTIFNKMDRIRDSFTDGDEMLRVSYLIELLVLINRLYSDKPMKQKSSNVPEKLIPILNYIDTHLDGDLSLAALESIFFIDKYYLSKIFKVWTGSNLHKYIIYKRISLAKRLLLEGLSVTDTSLKCGFNDYSNFIKMFKRTVGISPGKYYGTRYRKSKK